MCLAGKPASAAAAAHLPAFLPQHPDRRQLTSHPATAPAWAADLLQGLPQAQMTHADPHIGHTVQPSMHHSPRDAAGQSLQPDNGPQAADLQSAAAGQSSSEAQHPQPVPEPCPRRMQSHKAKPSAKQQATEATKLALQTEDARKGVTALQVTGATGAAPATALQATAVAQAPTAVAQAPAAVAQPPAAVAVPPTIRAPKACTAAVHATADVAQSSAAAVSAAAAASVPASIPVNETTVAMTAQKSAKPKKGAADAAAMQGRSSQAEYTSMAGQTQLSAQASDSAAASGSLQGYLAHASPGSLSRLKQDLRKPSASDAPMAAEDEPGIQPATVDTLQLQGPSAHTGSAAAQEAAKEAVDAGVRDGHPVGQEASNAAALQQQPAAGSAGHLNNSWDPTVADTIRQVQTLRQHIFAFASQVADPLYKQKFADALDGKPVSPTLPYSSDYSDSGSSSDSDAEPDQDTAGALPPVLDMHEEVSAMPLRQGSNGTPSSTPLLPASDAQPHRQGQQRTPVPHSPPSPRLYRAQPSPKRPPAMSSVGQLHSIQPYSQSQPAQSDQVTSSHMPDQAISPGRGLTARTAKRKQGDLPDASVLAIACAVPSQATLVAQTSEQPAGRKRGAGGSDASLASLTPGTL